MTDTQSQTSSGPSGAWSRAAAPSAASLSRAFWFAAPVLRRWGAGFTNWLVAIGWGKFFLLSILLLIFANLACSFIISRGSDQTVSYGSGSVTVDVHVLPLADGSMLVGSAQRQGAIGAGSGKPAGDASPDGQVLLRIGADSAEQAPAVRIDKQGVRILAEGAGRNSTLVIDHSGVRLEDAAAQTPAPGGLPAQPMDGSRAERSGAPPGAPAKAADPQKAAAAIEAARGRIESILQEQVDERLRQLRKGDRVERESWVVLLTTMTIVALIILKVVLGSKSKAESQARQASATAVQEGLKRQLAEAQLKMMQAQVEPHFLFNTLASVDYLIETDPARASRMQKNLIQYLRVALPQMREGSSTLGREILQCRSYLEILKVRMDERLHFSIDVPKGLLSAAFPPMMLLTLVENAIKHGLEPKPDGGSVSVSAAVADGVLRVAVADSGLGFGTAARGGTGVGLANVRERLQALYGAAAGLRVDANAEGGTIASIEVPYRIEAGGAAPLSEAPMPAGAL